MMEEVLPEETRHCALLFPWVMDASPWDKVSISRLHIKTLQTKGPLGVTHLALTTGRAADTRTEQPPRKAAQAQVLCL